MWLRVNNNKGFTLIEVIVAIVVLGIIVAPLGAATATYRRINAYADKLLQARLAVSSVAETMLEEGVDEGYIVTPAPGEPTEPSAYAPNWTGEVKEYVDDVTITVKEDSSEPLYDVTIKSNVEDTVSVTTKIRSREVGRK